MDSSEKRAKRKAKKEAEARKALEKQKKKEAVAAYKERHKNEPKDNVYDFLKTFLICLLIFAVILTPAAYMVTSISDIKPFGEENVALEDELPVLVDPESPFFAAFTESKKINVLVMGVNPPLTDTIMLFCLDPKQNKVDIISIPRDTYYYREGVHDQAALKINAAYRGNPVNSAYAVSETLMGIPINYYAVVEYDDVEKIVDAIGGVPMTIPDINGTGGMYYNDPYDTPPLKIALKAGYQVLNGEDSVKFLRYRKGYLMGDLGRVEAQQEWVKSAIKQGLSLGTGMIDVAKLACREIDSDITVGAAVKVATSLVGMNSENVTTYTMPNTPQQEAPYYVFPKTEEIEKMLIEIYSIPVEDETTDGAITE